MDLDKRYCQNRVRKRNPRLKQLLEKGDLDSEKDGRELKLDRFMRDVSTFVQSREHSPVAKTKRGACRSGIQTKYFKRDGLRKEKTATLDENLYKIIGVQANKENINTCSCLHHCRRLVPVLAESQPEIPIEESNIRSASGSSSSSSPAVLYKSNSVHSKTEKDKNMPLHNYNELYKKLYPDLILIITATSSKKKSTHFGKKSYANSLKKKLLCLYMQGKKENSQDTKSVGTSPMDSSEGKRPSIFTETPSEPCDVNSEENHFTMRDYVPNQIKSTRQFLEENIGPRPRAILQSNNCLPSAARLFGHHDQSRHVPSSRSVLVYKPHTDIGPSPSLPSPPLSYRPTTGNIYDFLSLNQPNWFIPQAQEDSPEFKYFPRKML